MLEFETFPKIGRMSSNCTITEKIDGTNAQIVFDEHGNMLVGSRKRAIFPEGSVYDTATQRPRRGTDNYGFAKWAYDNHPALFNFLGKGRHYGEWAGHGIQRAYGLDQKRFYLFNTARFGPQGQAIPTELQELGLDSVPVLYEGEHDSREVCDEMTNLKVFGSRINGFDNPEGVIVYLHGLKSYYKDTFEYRKGKHGKR